MLKLAIVSGKGGVGKTTLTMGLGYALKQAGVSVGLLDLDLENPSLGIACGKTRDDLRFSGEKIIPPLWHGIPIMGLSLLPLADFTYTPTMVDEERKHFLISHLFWETDWGDPEVAVLLIDTPPGTGEEIRGMLSLQPDAMLLVTSPQRLSEVAVRRVVEMASEYNLEIIGTVVNDLNNLEAGALTQDVGELLYKEHGLPVLARLGHDPAIYKAMESGAPVCLKDTDTLVAAITERMQPDQDNKQPTEETTEIAEMAISQPSPNGFADLTDAQWTLIAPLLPKKQRNGRLIDERALLDGLRWMEAHEMPLTQVPEKYGSKHTLVRRKREWAKSGTLEAVRKTLIKPN